MRKVKKNLKGQFLYKKIAMKVIESLEMRKAILLMDTDLNHMAEWADSSSPYHKNFLLLKENINALEQKRRLINEDLYRFGIDIL